jgi:hypothetical protein
MRFKWTALDRAASIAMLIAASVMVWASIELIRERDKRATPGVYAAGDDFPALQGIDFSASRATLLLFVRDGCKFCSASAGFYRTILNRPHRVQVAALSFDAEDKLRHYLEANNLYPDHAISADKATLRLGPTPTLLLISPKRKVERVWVGQLPSAAEEADVLRLTSDAIRLP